MSATIIRHTVDEYFQVEFASDLRHEYIDGEIVEMVGASDIHDRIHLNLVRILLSRFFESDFRICMNDVRVKVENPLGYLFPDMALVSGPEEMEEGRRATLLNPVAVFEILSPSTERYNRNRKYELYQSIGSLRHYVLISQDAISVECFSRQPDGQWFEKRFSGRDAEVAFEELDWKFPIIELYKKTNLIAG